MKYKHFQLTQKIWQNQFALYTFPKPTDIFDNAKTFEEKSKRFFFPKFKEFMTFTPKNCLTCSQFRDVTFRNSKMLSQPVSLLASHPREVFRNDLVGPLISPALRYVLTVIDVFKNHSFAVPLRNVTAHTVAPELKFFFISLFALKSTNLFDLGSSLVFELKHEIT